MGAGYQRVTKCMHGTMAAPDKGKKTRYVRENRLAHDGESPVHFVRGTDRHAIHYIKTPNPLYNARPDSQTLPFIPSGAGDIRTAMLEWGLPLDENPTVFKHAYLARA